MVDLYSVRLSFNIPIKDHNQLKFICQEEKIHLKKFLHNMILREIESRTAEKACAV